MFNGDKKKYVLLEGKISRETKLWEPQEVILDDKKIHGRKFPKHLRVSLVSRQLKHFVNERHTRKT